MLQGERAAPRASMGIAGLALGCCLLISAPSGAREAEWLHWSAPVECQNTGEVERRVQFLLGRPVDFAAVPATRVRMGWSAERGWAVRVTVELAAGPRYRTLDAPSCADAFDVIALSLALILDPDFEPAPEAQPPIDDIHDTGAESQAELASTTPDADPSGGLGVTPASAAAPDLPAASDTPSADVEDRDASLAERDQSFIVGVAGQADPWTFPVPQFGAAVQAAFRLGSARIEVEGDVLATQRATFAGARQPVSFSSLLGALRGCYGAPVTERLAWLGCAGAELGSLQTTEHGGNELKARGLWLAAQVLTGPELIITDSLWAFARFRAVAPLRRHEFVLSEGSRVYELPWVSLQLQVGVALVVTELGGGEH